VPLQLCGNMSIENPRQVGEAFGLMSASRDNSQVVIRQAEAFRDKSLRVETSRGVSRQVAACRDKSLRFETSLPYA